MKDWWKTVVEMYRDIPPRDAQYGYWVIGVDLFETMRADVGRSADRGIPTGAFAGVATLMGRPIEIGPTGSGIRFEPREVMGE